VCPVSRLIGIALVVLWGVSCSTSPGVKVGHNPVFDSFYEKARLIMTDEEGKVWKSLPNDASKKEFIEEFWEIRDPDPGTDENEAKLEFEDRIRYANMWFGTFNPRRGSESKGEDEEKVRTGWNEERGRVYLVMGRPDVIYFNSDDDETVSHDGSRIRPKAEEWTMEQWIYDRFRVFVVFTKSSSGSWRMENYDLHFYEVLEWAKLNWVQEDFKEDIKRRFRFKAGFSAGGFRITVPLDRITFDEKSRAEFGIKINVYLNRTKVDTVEENKILEKSDEGVFGEINIEFEIPYRTVKKGEYLFDIIIQDRLAPGFSKYRTFLRRKV
jgi:GWxTD domain-containing protein